MKIIKPLTIGFLPRYYQDQGRYYLALAGLMLFPFEKPRALLPETQLWPLAAGELGAQALDLGLPKPGGEVLVLGSCFTQNGNPAKCCPVKLEMGGVRKEIMVCGRRRWLRDPDHFDRALGHGWLLTDAEPFTQMPLTWNNAYGGAQFAPNPLGKGHLAGRQPLPEEGLDLPNLEYPDQMVANPWSLPEPAAFGPIDISLPQRAGKAGTFDQAWLENSFPGFPADMDWTMMNAAPPDQWIDGRWRGDESFALEGMHPRLSRLEGSLPGLRPRAFLNLAAEGGDEFKEVPLGLETVWLFPHLEKGICLYRGLARIASWDGLEIKHLLLAYEYLGGETRPGEDYQNALSRRLDKETAKYWLLRQDDLSPPEGVPRLGKEADKPKPAPPTLPPQVKKAQAQAEAASQELLQKSKAGIEKAAGRFAQHNPELARELASRADLKPPEPPPAGIEIPPLPVFKGLEDLPAVMSYLQELTPRLKAHTAQLKAQSQAEIKKAQQAGQEVESAAKAQQQTAEARLRDRMAKAGKDWDLEVAKAKETPQAGEPEPTDTLNSLRARLQGLDLAEEKKTPFLHKLDSSLKELAQVQAKAGPEKAEQAARKAQAASGKARLLGAHLLPAKSTASEEQRAELGAKALADLAAGIGLAGRDLAGADLRGADLRGADLTGADLCDARLSGARLDGAKLGKALLVRCDLTGAVLAEAGLAGANLGQADLSGADLSRADLRDAVLEQTKLLKARLAGADLRTRIVQKSDFSQADLSGLMADGVTFLESNLTQTSLAKSRLAKSSFYRCRLEKADLSQATAPKITFIACQAPGVLLSQSIMENASLAMSCDFSKAGCQGLNSPGANWRGTILDEADFSRAVLDGSDFSRCHLARSNFYLASAKGVRFESSDLSQATMVGINLFKGSLMGACLRDCDLGGSNLFSVNTMGSDIGGINLDEAFINRTQLRRPGEWPQS